MVSSSSNRATWKAQRDARNIAAGRPIKPANSKPPAPAGTKEYFRWHRYGLTPEAYNALLLSQDGKCAICCNPLQKPHVDHCHETGKVRGLLCAGCNTSIGRMGHDVAILQRAIEYLRT